MSQSFGLSPAPEENKWLPQHSSNLLKPPQILEYGPLQGHAGNPYRINLNIQNTDAKLLRIAFDSCITNCQYSVDTVTQAFTVHTTVPSLNLLSATSDLSRTPVYIVALQDATNPQIIDSWFVGYFEYQSSNKRLTEDSNDDHNEIKRPRQSAPVEPFNIASNYPTSSNYYGLSPHSHFVGLPPTQPSPSQRDYYEDTEMLGYPSTSTFRSTPSDPNAFQPSFGNAASYISTASPSAPTLAPHVPQQDPFIMPLIDTIPHHTLPTNTATAATITNATSIQKSPSTATATTSSQPPTLLTTTSSPPPSFITTSPQLASDPFANLLNKANLRIEGDLEEMAKDWTADEWETQRRIVQFWRRQEDNQVTCKFAPFQMPREKSQQPDLSKMIVVSCIYYKEKNDYFITSVDCIYLLENLIGVKFTVEEKNRIRRNLEGYKPLTVSKLKPESSDFFKLIMGFPNPKPRNIEKDVKVFPWSILAEALKKIISKYTASYSSTASVNYEALSSTTNPGGSLTTATTTVTSSSSGGGDNNTNNNEDQHNSPS